MPSDEPALDHSALQATDDSFDVDQLVESMGLEGLIKIKTPREKKKKVRFVDPPESCSEASAVDNEEQGLCEDLIDNLIYLEAAKVRKKVKKKSWQTPLITLLFFAGRWGSGVG